MGHGGCLLQVLLLPSILLSAVSGDLEKPHSLADLSQQLASDRCMSWCGSQENVTLASSLPDTIYSSCGACLGAVITVPIGSAVKDMF